jgi:hypothetical protein
MPSKINKKSSILCISTSLTENYLTIVNIMVLSIFHHKKRNRRREGGKREKQRTMKKNRKFEKDSYYTH